jgi:serine/threonine-protein kinase
MQAQTVIPWPVSVSNASTVYAPYPVSTYLDTRTRTTSLLLKHAGMLLPTVALQMFINQDNPVSTSLISGGSLQVGNQTLWTDNRLRAYPRLDLSDAGWKAAVDIISLHELMQGNASPERLRDKHVLVGVTAAGLIPGIAIPGGSMSPVQFSAHTLASMLDGRLLEIPEWELRAVVGLVLLVAILLLWLPSLGSVRGLLTGMVLLIGMLALQFWQMMNYNTWLDLSLPVSLLVVGSAVMLLFGVRKQAEAQAEMGTTEIHRRVGLASQKRGELDASFESFRKCPLDDSIMVMLYYLAHDFEEAERFDRAGSVYRYMRSHDSEFKDIKARAENARMLQDTVMMDTAGVMSDDERIDEDDDAQDETMLGRYTIERRIGKGAMGMVYLGADPKINRTVAIKTLNLKREFDADEQENVLQRFFREAEAAGRLHHPHIVTIYDAGEANDMAYIAMEYLTGTDLRFYTREDSLLPPLSVVKMGMKLADALAYAHSNKIIHRDIKAANVMYDPQTGQLKITDFGIARLTDSRRTKTGMVLGTPSSMSPEQLRGKKLDGRTDLYSLGVLLFQLLTGRLPYRADSLTRLMVKITTADLPDLMSLRPELKDNGACIVEIINKLLQKEADDRYQDGKKLARDLLACAKSMAAKK